MAVKTAIEAIAKPVAKETSKAAKANDTQVALVKPVNKARIAQAVEPASSELSQSQRDDFARNQKD